MKNLIDKYQDEYKHEVVKDIIFDNHLKSKVTINYSETEMKLPEYMGSCIVWQTKINGIKYEIRSLLSSKLIEIKILLKREDANNINFSIPAEIFEIDTKITQKIKDYGVEYKKLLEKALKGEKVKSINDKYGISKKWRAEKGHYYYFVDKNFTSIFGKEDKCSTEDDNRFENGNYFRIPEEAEEYIEYMKKKSLKWHEKRLENDKS